MVGGAVKYENVKGEKMSQLISNRTARIIYNRLPHSRLKQERMLLCGFVVSGNNLLLQNLFSSLSFSTLLCSTWVVRQSLTIIAIFQSELMLRKKAAFQSKKIGTDSLMRICTRKELPIPITNPISLKESFPLAPLLSQRDYGLRFLHFPNYECSCLLFLFRRRRRRFVVSFRGCFVWLR